MTSEMKQLYDLAVAAEYEGWDALVEQFAGEAAQARYDARGVSTAKLQELHAHFLNASEVWLTTVRQHRTAGAQPNAQMPESIIISVHFTAFPVNLFDPDPEIWATFDDGVEKMLHYQIPGDFSFTESELIGLTEEQAMELLNEGDPGLRLSVSLGNLITKKHGEPNGHTFHELHCSKA